MMTWFRGFIQGKTRIVTAWIFAFWIGFSARNYPALPGIALCFLGASLRYWASGYLRKDNRLAVGGPYALVRNPLYLGTYLMAVGIAFSISEVGLALVLSIVFGILYHFIILDEETKLLRLFGEPYRIYLSSVPRFFPKLFPTPNLPSQDVLRQINPDPEALVFSKEIARKNKAYEAYATFAGLVGLTILVAFLWQSFGGI